ncbi:EAL domain-containing protein [Oxalobacteraceae bacterium OM1]|nr:EAL domain-containing protein [Oxalobacteraceae bacterium OM1]
MNTNALMHYRFARARLTPGQKRFLRQHAWVIPAWLAAGLALGALLAGLLVSLLNATQRQLEEHALGEAKVLASIYAQQIGRTIGELDHTTSLLKRIWEHSEDGVRLEDLRKETTFLDSTKVGVSIANRDGVIVSSTLPGAVGMSVVDRGYFGFHRSSQSLDLHVSEPLAGRFADKEIVVFSRRLSLPNGEFAGVVSASTGTRYLAQFADVSILGSTGMLALVGEGGRLVAAKVAGNVDSALQPRYLREPAFGTRAAAGGVSPAGWFADDVARYLAAAPVPGYPLKTIIGLGQTDAIAPLVAERERYVKIGVAGGAMLALFTLIGTVMSLRLGWRKHQANAITDTYRVATEGANEGFYMWSPLYGERGDILDYVLADCNERGAKLYRRAKTDLIGVSLLTLYPSAFGRQLLQLASRVAEHGFYEDEFETSTAIVDGPRWVNRRLVRAGENIAVTIRDITPRKQLEQERHRLAEQDNLTQLPNRHWLSGYLPAAIQRANARQITLAALFVDLDKFKVVNDSWGHSVGDKLLHAVAERMRTVLRPSDSIARFGGDEFVVLLEGIQQEGEAADVALRIAAVLDAPFLVGQRECQVGASIGISLYPQDGTDAETLIRNADIAMYSAKADARMRYHFFNPDLFTRIQKDRELEHDLCLALERDQLVVHYQPRVETVGGALVGLEALVRWEHPALGLLYPGDFIQIAESSGLIVRLGAAVMEQVCAQLSQWRTDGVPLVPVSVNASARQFNEGSVKDLVAHCLEQFALPAGLIEIELTESAMVTNAHQVAEELTALRTMGVNVHLDDFGTGYSSLSTLHKLDVDVLKVDRAFTAELGKTADSEILFNAIISMARALGMKVVAEGVETEAQLRVLQGLGCDEVQGYFISKPLPAPAIAAFAAQRKAKRTG